jgi:hypothetical protein
VLATVGPAADGYAVTGSVPLRDVVRTAGLHVLDDGTVALTGDLFSQSGDVGFGLALVDPVEGVLRTTVVHPLRQQGVSLAGGSALSPDGRTMYLFSSTVIDRALEDRLVAVDVATGEVVAERDPADDVAAVSVLPVGRDIRGLVPRPGGGVTLVLDAAPESKNLQRIPTLLAYDEALEPVGEGVRVTSLEERAETQAVAAGDEGTVFLLVEVGDDVWITAVPDGGGAGPLLVALTSWFFDNALWVEPAQVWGLLPSYEGAVAVDLTSGELGEPVDLGCLPDRQVRAMFPRADGAGALLLGECDPETQMIWFVGP